MQDLEAWKPETVVWADDWGLLADIPSEQIRPILRSNFEKIAAHANRIIVVEGLPNVVGNFAEHSKGYNHNLGKVILNVWRKWNQFEPLALLKELAPERRLRVEADLRWAAETVPKVTFLPIAARFKEIVNWFPDGNEYIKLVDPYSGRLAYLDQVHLNVDGVRVLEGDFRKVVFGEPACNQDQLQPGDGDGNGEGEGESEAVGDLADPVADDV